MEGLGLIVANFLMSDHLFLRSGHNDAPVNLSKIMSLSVLTRKGKVLLYHFPPVPVLAETDLSWQLLYGQVLRPSPAVIADRGRCPGTELAPQAPQPTKMKMMGEVGGGMCDWHPSDS